MFNINPDQILDGVQSFVDQAARAISDGDRQAAVNSLNDALTAIKTLTGVLGLPQNLTERNQQNDEVEPT